MKTFLATGNVLLNAGLLAYAVIETDSEGQHLRLGFVGIAGVEPTEILLEGPEARLVLGWLRTNAEFLDAGGRSFRGNCARGPVIGRKTEGARTSTRAGANGDGGRVMSMATRS